MGRRLQLLKPEIRVLGIDDGKFTPHSKEQVLVIGVVFRGGFWFEGVMSTFITVDGFDGNCKIAEMIRRSPHFKQLRVIILNGITFGGFNVIDIKALNEETGLPVIAVSSKKPNLNKVHSALKHLSGSDQRWNAVVNAGELFRVETRVGKKCVYVELAGIEKKLAVELLRITSTRSRIPEALRVAHLVASGISLNTT